MTNTVPKRVYISGPMTGLPDYNFPAFFEAAAKLKAEGWAPTNPAYKDLQNGDVEKVDGRYVMTDRFDLGRVLLDDLACVRHANAIYLLEGWEKSKGARAEHALAVALDKEIIFEPSTPPLVGIGGLLASGKDTVADYLVEHHGYTKLNMSEPLHEAMLALNPIVSPGLDPVLRYGELVAAVGYTAAKENPEVRRLLQALGTEVGRKMFGENVWVDIAGRKIDALRAEGKPVVITGIRYPNELEMIRSRKGGHALWVARNVAQGAHASETSVQATDFDITIENISTLDALYASTEALAEEFAA